ncbi:hypothetical protein K440DRAFT_590012 [Wilcoxina mikolae CBS 423.85]|nr:hypothetical protein K440DRAFT_590012 [Wilcoxina mikolae CBS 423.85]
MSTNFVNTAMYAYTQRCAAVLYTGFFRGVQQAPSSYLSLGQEIDRLSHALEHLISEIHGSDSKLLRSDNSHAVVEALGIALYGIHGSLVEIENTLIGLHVSRHNIERWIDFAIKIQFHGGEERLMELRERVGYHCWAFDLVLRTLMKYELLASIETIAVEDYLERLLCDQIEGLVEDPTIRRFDALCKQGGKYLFTDFRTDTVVRIVMFWSFKAITNLRLVSETKHVSPVGYLNLLKAAWLFQKIRCTPGIKPKFDETKAVVALVSTELLFAFKNVMKVGIFPSRDSVMRHGDFTIFPPHLADQGMAVAPVEVERQIVFEQDIFDNPSGVSGRPRTSMISSSSISSSSPPWSASGQSVLPPPPPPYSAIADAEIRPPSSPPPSFPPPSIPPRSPERKRRRPGSLRVKIQNEDEHSSIKPLMDSVINKLPTPPSSAISLDGTPSSNNAILTSTIQEEPSITEAEENNEPLTPSPSAILDEIYCDSPTLGAEDYFELPITPEPASKPITPTTDRFAIPSPLELSPKQAKDPLQYLPSLESSVLTRLDSAPAAVDERIIASPILAALNSNRIERASVLQTYDPRAPSPNGLVVDDREWNVEFAIEYGVRPGEREVMPERFGVMNLKVSETCDPHGRWEDCIVRIFENQSAREFRLLTLRGKNIDQRHLPVSTTELVPEYGYNNNFPVIFLRKAWPGTYSMQTYPKEKGTKSNRKSSMNGNYLVGPPPPASLFYRFGSLEDMFTFQQAFLHETVEADAQNIRQIRYSRGFLSGENSSQKARIQLWKPPATELSGGSSSHRSSVKVGRASTMRTTAPSEAAIIKPTRLILYLDKITINIFVTDDVVHAIPINLPRTLRIRPSAHKTFNNPSSVKACVLGDPKKDISGGFRLDKGGLGIDRQDTFEDFKWFEIDFKTEDDCRGFSDDLSEALQQRRRDRTVIDELRKKAVRGIVAGGW